MIRSPFQRSLPGTLILITVLLSGAVCAPWIRGGDPELPSIILPPGFQITTFAEGVTNARGMCMGDRGTLFVGSRGEGIVHALRDTNGDGRADEQHVIARGLQMPVGLAFLDGELYISEVSRIIKLPAIEDHLSDPPIPVVVRDDFPNETHHGWKYIAFGPDGKLYVPVGAPCNLCEPSDTLFATIMRMGPDGSDLEIVAFGVRNSVGFDWDPRTDDLWFTDNGRDWMGDDLPPCELNHLSVERQHFGYPYCHGINIKDDEFGEVRDCSEFVQAARELGPHVAPLGMRFYTGSMFPKEYQYAIFIAEHGSWNRSSPIGYRISLVREQTDGSLGYEIFAEGWLQGTSAWGRPVDILQWPDGSLLVSDDAADMIYRISYSNN